MKKCMMTLAVFFMTAAVFSQIKPVFKINHAAVYVTDLKRSGEFYTKILNLDTIPEPFHDNRHIWLSIGNGVQLHIIQGAQQEREYFQNNHLCFSTDDVVSFSKKLDEHKIAWYSARGEAFKMTNRVDGVHQVFLKDPDGYWIEVNDAK
ncbi:MAG: VOC family protein [Chitinophagaceae bacterium]|nr:VOC family protein [Chitinophagaceae bacterium]